MPSEIIVRIAEWLPKKNLCPPDEDGFYPSRQKLRFSTDLGNFSLGNRRTRALLAEHVIFRQLDLSKTTFDQLQDLYDHREWLSGVWMLTCRVAVARDSHLHIGRSVAEYDALLASVVAKAKKVERITLNLTLSMRTSSAHLKPGIYLSKTVRAIAQLDSVTKLDVEGIQKTSDAYYALGVLQTWPKPGQIQQVTLYNLPDAFEVDLHT